MLFSHEAIKTALTEREAGVSIKDVRGKRVCERQQEMGCKDGHSCLKERSYME